MYVGKRWFSVPKLTTIESENIPSDKNPKFKPLFSKNDKSLSIKVSNSLSFDAILIDEARDFDQNWFLPVIQVLNPETNSLLITCDGLQGIYARKRFTWASVGIQARGRRSKRFEKSYRVPIEIGVAAREALPENLITLIDQYDEFISTKEYSGVHGIIEIIISKSRDEEYKALIEKISHLLKVPQEILLLFRKNMQKIGYKHPFFDQLKALNIEWKDLKDYHHLATGLYVGTLNDRFKSYLFFTLFK